MRPLVSYDDIASQVPAVEQVSTAESRSPPKKRRKNNRQGQRHPTQYTEDNEYKNSSKKSRRDYGLKEESRKLSHGEVWDDSALIRAWDAAVEEYEVLNGPDKKWKSEPVNKSPLWFNIPPEVKESSASPDPSFLMPSIPAAFVVQSDEQDQEVEPADPDNSQPVNFDTFVPRHDPTLSTVDATEDEQFGASNDAAASFYKNVIPPAPPGVSGHVSKDEAFQQAIGAWYWAGYWSGVYHSAGSSAQPDTTQINEQGDGDHESVRSAVGSVGNVQEEDIILDGSSSDEARVEGGDLLPT